MPFSGLKKKLRVGYVYIEESFNTIFIMGYGGEGVQRPSPMDYGSGKSPMDEWVNACATVGALPSYKSTINQPKGKIFNFGNCVI